MTRYYVIVDVYPDEFNEVEVWPSPSHEEVVSVLAEQLVGKDCDTGWRFTAVQMAEDH